MSEHRSETQSLEVQRSRNRDDTAEIHYRQREDGGWDVSTPIDDEFWGFMHSGDEKTVHQLIMKKWDYRYNPSGPDEFNDRS